MLCLERLGNSNNDVVASGHWLPFSFGRGESPKLSHMCFVDDLILVAEASQNQVNCINSILQALCDKSGQKVNFHKSQVFFSANVNDDLASSLSQALGVNITNDLGKYLGVPMLHQRVSKHPFSFILDKLKKKLSGWKASTLSFAGRGTLSQASLTNIPGYIFQSTSSLYLCVMKVKRFVDTLSEVLQLIPGSVI